MNELIKIRRELHSIAELSGEEIETSKKVVKILEQTSPDSIITGIAGQGIAAIYKGKNPKVTLMFRAELDALPIVENNDFEYVSKTQGVSHKCGHDGHMTILLGFASVLKEFLKNIPCTVVLLFQPAEETGEGANEVLNDSKFQDIKPDYIFGYHNLPGYDLGNIILKKGVFTSYSKGMVVELKGMTSHAGHPENGNSPVLAMSNIIQGLISLPSMHTKLGNSANITIIHALLGEIAFGTSPGNAVIRATLRSHESSDMAILEEKAIKLVKGIAQTYDLEYKISWEEIFPSVVNDNVCTDIISTAAKKLNFKIEHQTTAFSWSEDFGFFTEKYKGAFFGFGSGVSHPQLHNPHFDFPDELILPGVEILKEIIIETSKIK